MIAATRVVILAGAIAAGWWANGVVRSGPEQTPILAAPRRADLVPRKDTVEHVVDPVRRTVRLQPPPTASDRDAPLTRTERMTLCCTLLQ